MKSGIFLILLLIAIRNVDGKCSFKMSSQQACNSIANIAEGDVFVTYEELFGMVKRMYESMLPKLASANGNAVKACDEMTDNELWDTMRQRQEKRKEQFDNLNKEWFQLQERYEEMNRRHSKQLVSLQQTQSKYQACRALKTQLLENTTKLSTDAMELRRLYNLSSSHLQQKDSDYNNMVEQYKSCQQNFAQTRTVLSQMLGPSPDDDYVRESGVIGDAEEEFIILKQKATNFMKRRSEKQTIVDELVTQLKKLQTDNADLRSEVSQQQLEANLKDENCTKELLTRKELSQQNDEHQNVCFNKINGDFCTLENADLAHNETCWFERQLPADYNWRVVSDIRGTSRMSAVRDHTCSSRQGRFLFVDLSRLMTGQEAKLTSVPLQSNNKQCFSFWYNIGYAFNYGKFYAVALMRSQNIFGNRLQVWRQNLVTQEQWQFSSFEVPAHVAREGYRIELVAESNGPGYIAVDDLALTTGPCLR